MVEENVFRIEVRAYSLDWDRYIKHYNFSCKCRNGFTNVIAIRKNDEIGIVERFCLNSKDADSCRITAFIISPEQCKLSPLNVIVNVYRGEMQVDVRKFSRKWDEDTLTIDVEYPL